MDEEKIKKSSLFNLAQTLHQNKVIAAFSNYLKFVIYKNCAQQSLLQKILNILLLIDGATCTYLNKNHAYLSPLFS